MSQVISQVKGEILTSLWYSLQIARILSRDKEAEVKSPETPRHTTGQVAKSAEPVPLHSGIEDF